MGAGAHQPRGIVETKITPKADARALTPRLCNTHSIHLSLWGFLWGLSPGPDLARKFEAVHADFQRSIVSFPVRRNEKREAANEITDQRFPKSLSYGEHLLRGILFLPIHGGGKEARGESGERVLGEGEGVFSISAEMPTCQTAGSREGAGGRSPRSHSGPQGAAREAGRGAGDPSPLTFPSPA